MDPPFTQELLTYPVSEYPFSEPICRKLLGDVKTEVSLEQLHTYEHRLAASNSETSKRTWYPEFQALYFRFLREVILPHLGGTYLIFERSPNLRVHFSGARALTAPHTDAQHSHSRSEINFWVPITRVFDGCSLWVESAPGLGDFQPIVAEYGELIRFYGNQCLHFTKDNTTDTTRVSFDFRVVRVSDFARSGIPLQGEGTARFCLFGYYGVMCSTGELNRSAWQSLQQKTGIAAVPCAAQPFSASVFPSHARVTKLRSQSPEHRCRCGRECSERAARKRCARCCWLKARRKLQTLLVYEEVDGTRRPWIAEQPDLTAPWGLGCRVCSEAFAARVSGVVPSPFTDFTFGTAAPSLLVSVLIHHGNNSARQVAENGLFQIERDRGHETAVAWIRHRASR